MTIVNQPPVEGDAPPAEAGAGEQSGSSADAGGGSTAEAAGSEGAGDGAGSKGSSTDEPSLQDVLARLKAIEAENNSLKGEKKQLIDDVKALKAGKSKESAKAKTLEEQVAELTGGLSTLQDELARDRAALEAKDKQLRRNDALTEIVKGVPSANLTTVRRLAAALEAEGKIDLAAEDRDATVRHARQLLEAEHSALLKEPENADPFPNIPKTGNAPNDARGAGGSIKGLGQGGKSVRVI